MPLNEIEIKLRDEQREVDRINRKDKFRRYDPPHQFNNGRNRSPRVNYLLFFYSLK